MSRAELREQKECRREEGRNELEGLVEAGLRAVFGLVDRLQWCPKRLP